MPETPELLAYLGHKFGPADHDGQAWLRADELGHAMGLANPERDVAYIHQNNWEQFSDRLTARLPVETAEGPRLMLAFNPLGAYVVSTFFLSPDARQFRRWLLETLVIQQIDTRRELQRLRGQNEALEKRVAALEADMAGLKRDLLRGAYQPRDTQGQESWLEGEWRTMREQQARQGELLQCLADTLESAPAAASQPLSAPQIDAELDQLRRLRHAQLDQVDILREIVAEIRSLQNPPCPNECPPRPLSLEGPFPVWLGRIGGRDCPVVSARDLHAFLGTGEDYGDWACWHTRIGHGLAEHIDYEHLRWLRPEGMHVGTGNYLLSLNAVVEVVRNNDSLPAELVRDFIIECRERMTAWLADSLVPPAMPLPDFLVDGGDIEPNGPMLFHFDDLPIRVERDEQGRDWWCAKDVCAVLGYANVKQTISDHCKQDGVSKRYPIVDSLGRTQYPVFINDPNFYRLIAKSRKPEAERFERWVFEEVIPAVNRTGRYEHPTHGRAIQPTAAIPAATTPPKPALAAKPDKAGGKPAKPKADSRPKTQRQARPTDSEGQA